MISNNKQNFSHWPKILFLAAALFYALLVVKCLADIRAGGVDLSFFLCLLIGAVAVSGALLRLVFRWKTGRALVLCLAVFALLLSGEIYLRIGIDAPPDYGEGREGGYYRSLWSRSGEKVGEWLENLAPRLSYVDEKPEYRVPVNFNSLGIRDREIPLARHRGEYRVVCLGDSSTLGAGANLEASWPKVLEKRLQEMTDRPVRVVNAGVSGADPVQMYGFFKERLVQYDPDLVVLAVNSTNLESLILRGGRERLAREGGGERKGPWWEWLYGSSFLVRHVVHDLMGHDRLLLSKNQRLEEQAKALGELRHCLGLFESLARSGGGFDFLVVFHPTKFELITQRWAFGGLVDQLGREGMAAHADLLQFFLRTPQGNGPGVEALFWPVDLHYNAAGYDLFARGVEKSLKEQALFAPLSR